MSESPLDVSIKACAMAFVDGTEEAVFALQRFEYQLIMSHQEPRPHDRGFAWGAWQAINALADFRP